MESIREGELRSVEMTTRTRIFFASAEDYEFGDDEATWPTSLKLDPSGRIVWMDEVEPGIGAKYRSIDETIEVVVTNDYNQEDLSPIERACKAKDLAAVMNFFPKIEKIEEASARSGFQGLEGAGYIASGDDENFSAIIDVRCSETRIDVVTTNLGADIVASLTVGALLFYEEKGEFKTRVF